MLNTVFRYHCGDNSCKETIQIKTQDNLSQGTKDRMIIFFWYRIICMYETYRQDQCGQ